MAKPSATQTLSYNLRLPKEAQEDALRLLDASRAVINATLTRLWPAPDAFTGDRTRQAWKQVAECIGSSDPHGDRQWRCESETAGRILRTQATRKQVFILIQPILTDGFIRPKTDRKPAGKHRHAITAAITALRQVQKAEAASGQEDGESTFVALQNVVEQCCNYYLANDRFPDSYEEMQPPPVLKVGLLTYAGDDGPDKGQAYHLRLALEEGEAGVAYFRFRCPDARGVWGWRPGEVRMALPERLREQLRAGEWQAPTLREERSGSGERTAVLDIAVAVTPPELVACECVERVLGADWGVHTLLTATAVDREHHQIGRPCFLNTGGFDGRQARTRRQIDQLEAKKKRYEQDRDALPHTPADPMHPTTPLEPLDPVKAAWYAARIAGVEQEITRCWRKYDLRNRTLAHLAANVLLLLAQLHDCSLLAMESLETLKTTGRGKGVRGRWRNYRNNTTIRGEIWRLLRYKCHLAGMRFRTVPPAGTSHTCPRCGTPAQTYRSPQDAQHGLKAVDWGRWLRCAACGYSADRDYAASLNIARLGVAMLLARHHRTRGGRAIAITDPVVRPVTRRTSAVATTPSITSSIHRSNHRDKPSPYTDGGSALLLPPTGSPPARSVSLKKGSGRGTICYLPGWERTVFLQSSLPRAVFPSLRRKRSAA